MHLFRQRKVCNKKKCGFFETEKSIKNGEHYQMQISSKNFVIKVSFLKKEEGRTINEVLLTIPVFWKISVSIFLFILLVLRFRELHLQTCLRTRVILKKKKLLK